MSRAHTFRRTRSAIVPGRRGPTRQRLASRRASASITGESDERSSRAQIGHETADFLCSQLDIASVIHLLWTGNLKVSPYRCESDFRVSLPLGLAIGTGRIGRSWPARQPNRVARRIRHRCDTTYRPRRAPARASANTWTEVLSKLVLPCTY